MNGQAPLLDEVPGAVEDEAQRIAAQLLARSRAGDTEAARDLVTVDVDTLSLTRPRSVGVEQVGLWAIERLGLVELLAGLGVNAALCTAALGSIVARLAYPASERATHAWLRERSALGELLKVDFETMGAMQLYRASDALIKHREAIEAHLFDRAIDLFDLAPTVTLYDLTNTFYEGEAADQPNARRGHSKEKRSDCKLLTLGLGLDAGGFVRRSRVFAGNVKEDRTLQGMLEALGAPPGSRVVLDRGIATQAQIDWLAEHGYRYIVVSRERRRRFDAEAATAHRTRTGGTVHLEKVADPEGGEVRLYCYSEERANKERGIAELFAARFERDLKALDEGLSRPRTQKKPDMIWQRIGRLKEKSRGVGQHYDIEVEANETGERAVAVRWRKKPVTGTMLTHPGVYCLRSNEIDWSEQRLWRTYTLLTGSRGGVPCPEIRTGPAPHPSPQGAPRRGASVHHGNRLPTRPGDPPAPGRARRRADPQCELDDAQADTRRAPTRDRDVQARRQAHRACAQGDACRAETTGDTRCLGNYFIGRGDAEGDRLSRNHRVRRECSAIHAILTA